MSLKPEIRLTGVRMAGDSRTGLLFSLLGVTTQHIQAVTDGRQSWTVAEVGALVDMNSRFYVEDRYGARAYVEVVRTQGHVPYIRTHKDNTTSDNLLSLPGGPFYTGATVAQTGGLLNPYRSLMGS
jgi:hypothetical protein